MNCQRGWRTAWYEYQVMPRILRWRMPAELPLEKRAEIHLLTSHKDWLFAAWMLVNFCADWLDAENDETWLNSDFQHSLNIKPEEALAKWGIKLWPLVNSGLVLLNPAIVDLDFCEQCIA